MAKLPFMSISVVDCCPGGGVLIFFGMKLAACDHDQLHYAPYIATNNNNNNNNNKNILKVTFAEERCRAHDVVAVVAPAEAHVLAAVLVQLAVDLVAVDAAVQTELRIGAAVVARAAVLANCASKGSFALRDETM